MNVTMPGSLLDLYSGKECKQYKDVSRNPVLLKGFVMAVETMKRAKDINEIKAFSRLHYEKLKYEYLGYSSVRLSNSFVHRLIFLEKDDGIEIQLIEIDDTHYGNK